MTEADWAELGKLFMLIRERKANSVETKVGSYKIKIYRVITTIRIDLQEIA